MKPSLSLIIYVNIIICCLAYKACCQAIQPRNIYFLSIGSSDYIREESPDKTEILKGFNDVDGANRSARIVANMLEEAGSKYGICLTSQPDKLITPADVEKQLKLLTAKIKQDKSANPFIVFYFCGHGISEGISLSYHYSVPGSYLDVIDSPNIEILEAKAISTLALHKTLTDSGKEFLILLDNCYTADDPQVILRNFDKKLAAFYENVGGILAKLNEITGSNLVVYAAHPGTEAPTVENPLDPSSDITIGPLARRMSLIYTTSIKSNANLTFTKLISELTSPSLDNKAKPAYLKMKIEGADKYIIKRPVTPSKNTLSVNGTGNPDQLLKNSIAQTKDLSSATADDVPIVEVKNSNALKVYIKSEAGEFIGDGKTHKLSSKKEVFNIDNIKNGIQISTIIDNFPNWMLTFEPPKGKKLAVGKYVNCQRAFMKDQENLPGIDISGESRGCNETNGKFEILQISYNANGTVKSLAIDFEQYCDDQSQKLIGQVRYNSSLPMKETF